MGQRVAEVVWGPGSLVNAPHLLDVEVAQVVGRLVRSRKLTLAEAEGVVTDLGELDLLRHEHVDLLERVLELHANATAYDGVYLALAEALGAELVTCDAKLGRVPGIRASVRVVA